MATKEDKKIVLARVINSLKKKNPELNYDLLPDLNINVDSKITEVTDNVKDFTKILPQFSKMQILKPFHQALLSIIKDLKQPEIADAKKKLKRAAAVEETLPIASDDEEQVEPPKKEKKKVKKSKPNISEEIGNAELAANNMFANEEYKLSFANPQWWKPFSIINNKLVMFCFCPSGSNSAIKETNRWNGQKQLKCPNRFQKNCGFLINCTAAFNLKQYMDQNDLAYMPIPKCSCQKVQRTTPQDKNKPKQNVVVRGSAEGSEEQNLWYFCEGCKSPYFFKQLEAQFKRIFPKAPKSTEEDDEDIISSDDEEIEQEMEVEANDTENED